MFICLQWEVYIYAATNTFDPTIRYPLVSINVSNGNQNKPSHTKNRSVERIYSEKWCSLSLYEFQGDQEQKIDNICTNKQEPSNQIIQTSDVCIHHLWEVGSALCFPSPSLKILQDVPLIIIGHPIALQKISRTLYFRTIEFTLSHSRFWVIMPWLYQTLADVTWVYGAKRNIHCQDIVSCDVIGAKVTLTQYETLRIKAYS